MTRQQHPRIPTCTYRLQFNRWFTFSQARQIVSYLGALGVSDVYASPYFQASPDSLHGYDITDHNKLNEAIGSRADHDAWAAELRAHSMGQILDFVPNHVGIADSRNQWWMDVLENGPSSRYAPYFDIDWQPRKFDLRDKVLLPILSDQYGRVLERGEFQVRFEEGRLLRAITKHSDCARIFAEANRKRSQENYRAHSRKRNYQKTLGAALCRSAASASGHRKGVGADQWKTGRCTQLRHSG